MKSKVVQIQEFAARGDHENQDWVFCRFYRNLEEDIASSHPKWDEGVFLINLI